jgi:NADPH2:quinone reductase
MTEHQALRTNTRWNVNEESIQMPELMKVIGMREPGSPEVLEAGSRPVPIPAADEVLVKTIAVGVNGPDLVQRRGHYPPPAGASDLLGLEVSGEIIALGSNVSTWSIGDKICALTNGGGYAEQVAISATHCLPIPETVGEIDAAGLCETFFTVWSNFFFNRDNKKGDIFLVHGGAGGIGSTAIQLGAAFGLRMLTTCRGADDASYCTSIGAERAIDYAEEDFVEIVRKAGGANLILDIIGGDYVARNIKAASPDALIVQLAFNAGSTVEINLMPIMLKRIIYTGSTLRSRPDAFKSAVASELRQKVWPLFADGVLKPNTYAVLPFEQAVEAHKMMEAGSPRGKILLTP